MDEPTEPSARTAGERAISQSPVAVDRVSTCDAPTEQQQISDRDRDRTYLGALLCWIIDRRELFDERRQLREQQIGIQGRLALWRCTLDLDHGTAVVLGGVAAAMLLQ